MASGTLVAAGLIATAVGISYILVARSLRRREGLSPESRRALSYFAAWWGLLGVNVLVAGAMYFWAGLATTLPLWVQVLDSVLQRALLSLSMVGLMAYLSYVVSGKARLGLFASIYGAFFVYAIASMAYHDPVGVLVTGWRTDLVYAVDPYAWEPAVNLLVLILPPVVGAIAYLRLYPRAAQKAQRYRIALVSGSILVWWLVAVLAGQRAALENDWLQPTQRILGLVTALAVLAAYRPPRFIRRRLGMETFSSA